MSTFCSLPEEILIHILSLTHPAALVACRAVCRLLLKMIEETMVLTYRIELFADGMIDGENCQLTMAERLSQLRFRRQAWKDVKREHRTFPLIPGSWNAYELVDGVFSKTLNSIEHNSARGILFATLPSRYTPGSLTIYEDVGIVFRDFAMDPTQDLVVYMQCIPISGVIDTGVHTRVILHFRTISGNKVHPRGQDAVYDPECSLFSYRALCTARGPFVSVILETEVLGAVIQTVDQVVGFMSWDNSRSQLYIWDWRECLELVSESHLPALDDFAFISDRAYVLTSPVPEPCFQVYTFDSHPRMSYPPPPTLCATLLLPALKDDASASLLGIHTGPFTTVSPQPLRSPKPFTTAPHARIHVVNIELSHNDFPEPSISCLIVVRNRTFLSYVEKPEALSVPWEDWGPENTRWIPGGTGSRWLRYVHGERMVRLQAVGENGLRYLELYDFGAPRCPPSWRTKEEDYAMRLPHEIHLEAVFASPVIFQLPCRVVTRQESFPYSGFMVDEDRLIGLKRHWADNATSVDVFTF